MKHYFCIFSVQTSKIKEYLFPPFFQYFFRRRIVKCLLCHQVSQDHSGVPLRVDGRYSLQEPLSLGAYATIYKAVNIINHQIYAIKLEACSEERISSVEREYYILKQLCSATVVGIPQVHWFGQESSFDAMVLDLLGPSLHDLLGFQGKFDPLTVHYVGNQLLSQVHYIHSRGYVHGDIQPQNILMGLHQSLTIFITNFGGSTQFRHPETGAHVPFCQMSSVLAGTPAFTSINSHLGAKLSQCDDLRSLVYLLIYLTCGTLPWLQPRHKSRGFKHTAYSAILEHKQTIPMEQLCADSPKLSSMLLYIHALSFSETPDYGYIHSLLRNASDQSQLSIDEVQIIRQDLSQADCNDLDPSAAQCLSPAPPRHRQVHTSLSCGPTSFSVKSPMIAV
ncbi:hypothetical protein PISMIDRAFT_124190 [Pisolithus microcarpus 441]|uniref:Protein kinase domain-containing protein n=1 Tax=Pisolithus microcarpus 441 TaxID=765257 RepID=A0A0C9Y9C4_9AGAM|nr:hypothetical protein PISMIDRAFT_124190 [Pisolithus microcarpus 441]